MLGARLYNIEPEGALVSPVWHNPTHERLVRAREWDQTNKVTRLPGVHAARYGCSGRPALPTQALAIVRPMGATVADAWEFRAEAIELLELVLHPRSPHFEAARRFWAPRGVPVRRGSQESPEAWILSGHIALEGPGCFLWTGEAILEGPEGRLEYCQPCPEDDGWAWGFWDAIWHPAGGARRGWKGYTWCPSHPFSQEFLAVLRRFSRAWTAPILRQFSSW